MSIILRVALHVLLTGFCSYAFEVYKDAVFPHCMPAYRFFVAIRTLKNIHLPLCVHFLPFFFFTNSTLQRPIGQWHYTIDLSQLYSLLCCHGSSVNPQDLRYLPGFLSTLRRIAILFELSTFSAVSTYPAVYRLPCVIY